MADEDPPGEVVLVRHGQTEWSAVGRHTGGTDLPLLPQGEEQARALVPVLAARQRGRGAPVAVLSSPLQRAWRTAQLAGLDDVTPEPDLVERGYGGAEGVTLADLRVDHPGLDVWHDPLPPAADGTPAESVEDLADRVGRVVERVRPMLDRGDVVLVAHGHSLRALAARWLGLPASAGELFALEPARASLLGVHHDVPVVRGWNLPPGAQV